MNFQFEQKNLRLIVKIGASVPAQIFSDENRYKQILYNLIANALKFTFDGQGTVSLVYNPLDDELSTTVTDSGIGMTKEE